jgi:hypothetical protein
LRALAPAEAPSGLGIKSRPFSAARLAPATLLASDRFFFSLFRDNLFQMRLPCLWLRLMPFYRELW